MRVYLFKNPLYSYFSNVCGVYSGKDVCSTIYRQKSINHLWKWLPLSISHSALISVIQQLQFKHRNPSPICPRISIPYVAVAFKDMLIFDLLHFQSCPKQFHSSTATNICISLKYKHDYVILLKIFSTVSLIPKNNR